MSSSPSQPSGSLSGSHLTDPFRPRIHYLPPSGWINDPNGLIYWRGQYHLFFQHNPHEVRWEAICWGHAVSDDLVSWRHLPTALMPDLAPESPDASGVWSGCAVADGEELRLVYTAARGYDHATDQADIQIRSATSRDGVTFTKDAQAWVDWPWGKTVGGHVLTGFRDPWVWREGAGWKMLVGSGIAQRGGTVMLYESPDLNDWREVGPLVTGHDGHPLWTGTVWECPQLLDFAGGTVVTLSAWHERQGAYVAYLSGKYDGRTLKVTDGARLDWGDTFYAAQSLRDEHGDWVLIGWLRELRPEEQQRASGWSGCIALPRLLKLLDGKVVQQPHPNLRRLRGRHTQSTLKISGERQNVGTYSGPLELALHVQPDGRAFSLRLHELEEEVTLRFDPASGELTVERGPERPVLRMPLPAQPTANLHLFVDASVLEIFSGGHVLTTRLFPRPGGTYSVELAAEGVAYGQIETWELTGQP